jgi:hypothetical protein
LAADQETNRRPDNPVRRYEVFWERESSLPAIVEEAWSRRIPGQDLGDVASSLSAIMENLYKWKRMYFKSVPKEIAKKCA